MRDRIFYSICFGFIFGILIRSFLLVNFYIIIFIGALAGVLFLFFTLISKNKWGVITSLFILALSLGMLRFGWADKQAPDIFESKVGENVVFMGKIIDEPDVREDNQKLNIKIKEAGKDKIEHTEILVTVGLEEEFKYGDEVKIEGKLSKPENFDTDTGKVFDYISYLRKDGILYTMSYPKAEVLSGGNGSWLKTILFNIKNKFLERMNYAITPPESTLLGGLILGERSSFSADMRQKFIDTGTIHIIALSGYNVTIVAQWFMRLFSFFPQGVAIGFGILAIFLFVLMSGANSTAIRAGIMATLALIARATGRNYDVARALMLTAVGMLLFNPFILVFDVSFELSFIATIAVIFLSPRIEKHFLWVTKRFSLRDIVSVTFSAYIFVLPFILYKMGNLSIVALPANILILPFIPVTMLLGFLTGFLGLIFYFLSVPFGLMSSVLLKYELWVIDFLSSLPFASFSIPNFPLLITLGIYACFVYFLFGASIKRFFLAEI